MQKIQRVLLKISGEALGHHDQESGPLSHQALENLVKQIKPLHEQGLEIGVVLGGGNIFRGGRNQFPHLDRAAADMAGMFATYLNSILLSEYLLHSDVKSKVMGAKQIDGIVETFDRNASHEFLRQKNVVLFAGGTGHPFFTTDTAAALRALEIKADLLIKATNVDGVFDKDPNQANDAKKFDTLSFEEALSKQLKVMDMTAFSLCQEYQMPIYVCNLHSEKGILDALSDQKNGTLVR